MIHRKITGVFLPALWVVILTAATMAQADKKTQAPAEIVAGDSNVSWFIKVPYESATLTVSAPNGTVFRKEFPAGALVTFSPLAQRAKYWSNGQFNYEITLQPVLSDDVKQALAQSRRDGNGAQIEAELKRRGVLPTNLTSFGTFTIVNGTVFTSNETIKEEEISKDKVEGGVVADTKSKAPTTASLAPQDQVIPDDLIVQGSACFGLDCVNNEIFGFDTIKLKENNLRIKFEDTSASAGFPSTDWQITANDSASGGANKFSIEDITSVTVPFTISGGAPSNSLFVSTAGKIGIQTSTPVLDLHIASTDTPAIRLEQNNSGGFTAQTWDVAGNEANFFVRDLTNGSRLPFRIRPGAPTSSLDISAEGKIGIGTASPSERLDVRSLTNPSVNILQLSDSGQLTIGSTLKINAGGIVFPDGTSQTTAATGGGGSGSSQNFYGPQYSQYIFGGQGTRASFSTITPVVDFNRYSIGTNAQNGFSTSSYTVPSNVNLSDRNATQIVYVIRYRDTDGTGTASQVRVDLVGVATNGGGRNNTVVFDSNTNSASGFNTVTVCKPNTDFDFANRGYHFNVSITGTAAQSADFGQIQVYKSLTCP